MLIFRKNNTGYYERIKNVKPKSKGEIKMVMRTKLMNEFIRRANEIETMDVTTEEYTTAIKNLAQLESMLSDIEKNEIERMKANDARKTQFHNTIMTAVKIGGGLMLTLGGTVLGLMLEERGTIFASPAAKKHFNDMLDKFNRS
jgi:hypothetical protein